MKYIVLLSLILLSDFVFAQKDTIEMVVRKKHAVDEDVPVIAGDAPVQQTTIFKVVEQMPEYPGGEMAMMKFIQSNIQYPMMEKENDIQGRVVLKFIVNEDGSVSDITVRKSLSPGLDKEAIRLVRLLPKFKPGMQQGKAVRVEYMLPILFKLPAEEPVKKQ